LRWSVKENYVGQETTLINGINHCSDWRTVAIIFIVEYIVES